MTTTILVCGSRDVDEAQFAGASIFLDGLAVAHMPNLDLVHGQAAGADTLAHRWAVQYGVTVHRHPADWSTHGRAAGPIRNQLMLDSHDVDLVLAVVSKPLRESRGTADMVHRARQAGIPTHIIRTFRPRR